MNEKRDKINETSPSMKNRQILLATTH